MSLLPVCVVESTLPMTAAAERAGAAGRPLIRIRRPGMIAYWVDRATVYVTVSGRRIGRLLTYGLAVSTALTLALDDIAAAVSKST